MSSNLQEVALARSSRSVTVPPLYVSTHGYSQEDEQHAQREMAFALRLDGKGAHYPGAQTWGHVHVSSHPHALFFFFQLGVLLAESCERMGGLQCSLNPQTDGKLYQGVVTATAASQLKRKVRHWKKNDAGGGGDDGLAARYTSQTKYFSPGFARDVMVERQRLEAEAKKKGTRRKKGEEEEEEEERVVVVAAPRKRKHKRAAPRVVRDTRFDHMPWVKDLRFVFWGAAGPDGESIPGSIPEFDGHPEMMKVNSDGPGHWEFLNNLPDKEGEEEDEEDEEDEEGEEEEEEGAPPPYDGPLLLPKVSMTVTPIQRDWDAVLQEPTGEVVALLVRLLVFDPTINPGLFFQSVEENLRARHAQRLAPQFRSTEMFPAYAMRCNQWHPAGPHCSLHTYVEAVMALCPELKRNDAYRSCTIVSPASSTHLYNVVTLQRALATLLDAEVDARVVGTVADWRNGATARFPHPTFKYLPDQIFWQGALNVGLSEQYFPHVDLSSDFIRNLMGNADMSGFFRDGYFTPRPGAQDTFFTRAERTLREMAVVPRERLRDHTLIKYQTYNEFVHRYAETKEIYKQLSKYFPAYYARTVREVQRARACLTDPRTWRRVFLEPMGEEEEEEADPLRKAPQLSFAEVRMHLTKEGMRERKFLEETALTPDFRRRVIECDRYSLLLETTQGALTKVFCNLWLLEGDIDGLPIPLPIRTMLKWYRDTHAHKIPNMTRRFYLIDDSLDVFGNIQLRYASLLTSFARVLQPMICMMAEGTYSCYDAKMRELCFYMMVTGRFDIGKTFAAITTLVEFITIPDTVNESSLDTAAADTTARHTYDSIRASDECPLHFMNAREAEREHKQVNKDKEKMTAGKLTINFFDPQKLPDGSSMRWTSTVQTDYKESRIFISNIHRDEEKSALSSRMLNVVMKMSKTPAGELNGNLGAELHSDARLYMQINQFLSACGRKAAAVGAILPDVQLDLFNDISNKIIFYLKENRYVGASVGPRSVELMKPYIRQLVYKYAIHCAFDMPFEKNYRREFKAENIRAIQPYLYVTTSMVWWTWTAYAGEFINDDYTNVIRAMIKVANVEWNVGDNPYKIFESDIHNRVPWRTHKNTEYRKGEDLPHDDVLIDLQYLTLEGTLDQIAGQVAERTNPKLSEADVEGLLKHLAKKLVHLPRGGYKPQPRQRFEMWHKFTDLPSEHNGHHGVKHLHEVCPPEYVTDGRSPAEHMRTEDDAEALGDNVQKHAVDLCDLAQKKVLHFMPYAQEAFLQKVIQEALVACTMCASTRPGKILLGTTDPLDNARFETIYFSEEDIEETVTKFDEGDGWEHTVHGGLRYVGQGEPATVPRRTGIAFNRRGAMTDADFDETAREPIAPVRDDAERDAKMARYREEMDAMSAPFEVVADLDEESALRQHVACGRPLDEPVRSPKWIMEQYQPYRQPGEGASDYPHDKVVARAAFERQWGAANMEHHRNVSSTVLDKFRNRRKKV
jgi:hypothetical protein